MYVLNWINLHIIILLVNFSCSQDIFRGFHATRGTNRGVQTTLLSCINFCVNLSGCWAVDYNSRDNTCWSHDHRTACTDLFVRSYITHAKVVPCGFLSTQSPSPVVSNEQTFENSHVLGGSLVGVFLTLLLCKQRCMEAGQGVCSSIDYSTDGNCYLHGISSACVVPKFLFGVTHVKLYTCDGQQSSGASSQVINLPSVPGVRCGVPAIQPIVPRIIGGFESKPHSWPWQVALYRARGSVLSGTPYCGGALISSTVIVTAAHCVRNYRNNPNLVRVLLGAHVLPTGDTLINSVRSLNVIRVHPNHSPASLDNDIALLQLSTPVTFTDMISPICLQSQSISDGSRCVVAGWGETIAGSGQTSSTLQQVTVYISNQQSCVNTYSRLSRTITRTMICAASGAAGSDSCQGDSGSGLVCQRDGLWYLTGLTSFGRGCGNIDYPGVYSRVQTFTTWINSQRL